MAHSCLHSTTAGAAIWACPAVKTVSSNLKPASVVRCAVHRKGENVQAAEMPRREALAAIALGGALSWLPGSLANATSLPPGPPAAKLCDGDCEKDLDNIPLQTTESGLQYKDIVVGDGEVPIVGFQVAANYVAMIPGGKIFDSSLDKGIPYIFRVGAGAIIKGLDEGILTMKVGGKRRLYIPGELAYPKGLGAAAGRPRVPPSSPVIFDTERMTKGKRFLNILVELPLEALKSVPRKGFQILFVHNPETHVVSPKLSVAHIGEIHFFSSSPCVPWVM